MKIKSLVVLLAAAALLAPAGLRAQTTNRAASTLDPEMQPIFQSIQAKVKAGQKTEADLADDLARIDQLLARRAGEKTDAVAQILYLKATLYLQVLDEPDKGKALILKLKADYPDTKLGKNADKILQNLDKQAAAKKIQAALVAGSPFPDFNENDLNGQPLSVAALKGKVVLVDFWATWCGPCRAELPNVIETYKKHHGEGFEIIGVSLDSDRAKLDEFLKQTDGMTWPEYFDGLGWGNKLAGKYGVESIPFAVLIGPDGKIIGKSLRGEKLEAAVSAALAKK
jgi:thiol-disulfide isomerase/thioredoxin